MSKQEQDPGAGPGGRGEERSIDLLRRAQEGDREALETLVRRYLPRLARWATGRLPREVRGMQDTEDLVQDVLVQTVRRLDLFEARHEAALQAYIRQALLNRIREQRRFARRRPGSATLDSGSPDPGDTPLEKLIGRESISNYEKALSKLRPADREAVILRVELGYDYRELAAALGKPTANAARMTVSRALLRLAREISDAS